ncbi:hypothetical protein D3C80_1202170 [compost metagenome]
MRQVFQRVAAAQAGQVFAGQAGLVAEQATQGHGVVGAVGVRVKTRTHAKLRQGLRQRCIERQTLLLDQLQGGAGSEQLRQRACAKRGIGRHAHMQILVGQAKTLGPHQRLAVDQCQRQPRHMVLVHQRGDTLAQLLDHRLIVALANLWLRLRGTFAAATGQGQKTEQEG